ncbi:MAG: phage holin family protein [Flavobacteriaceae bacterium]|jgi:putative membrane protein|nr:phage holin family protein [Flavobacteriaceae bacterium]
MKFIIRLLITAVVAYGLTHILSGVQIKDFKTAVIFATALAIINITVKPILQLFGLPLTILTLGLFLLVINAITILIADYFIDGMHVSGFWQAFIFSILLSVITSLLNSILIESDKD